VATRGKESGLSKAKRLRLLIGALLLALSVSLSGTMAACSGAVTEKGKTEAKKTAEEKEKESQAKQKTTK
jgi:hypothetical protein